MVFLGKEVPVCLFYKIWSGGMTYRLIPPHFEPWAGVRRAVVGSCLDLLFWFHIWLCYRLFVILCLFVTDSGILMTEDTVWHWCLGAMLQQWHCDQCHWVTVMNATATRWLTNATRGLIPYNECDKCHRMTVTYDTWSVWPMPQSNCNECHKVTVCGKCHMLINATEWLTSATGWLLLML